MPTISRRSTSSADPTRDAQSGLTLIEVLVALFLIAVISALFFAIYIGTMNVNMFLESHNDLTTIGQRTVNTLKDEITQSRVLFQDDALGQGYLAQLTLPTGQPIMPGSVLPVTDPTGRLEPDNGPRRVGNSLLMVRGDLPETVTIDHDGDSDTPDIEMLADLYRFQLVYLSRNTGRSFRELGYYLELVQASSEPYADYFQLSGLSATARAAVAAALNAEGVNVAWDPGQPVNQAFYDISSGGSLNGPTNHSINLSEYASLMPQFRGGRVEGNMNYSVAMATNPPIQMADPLQLFAQPTQDSAGFESLIVGPSASRKTLLRLVLAAEYGKKVNSAANTVIATTSEY